MSPPTKTTEQFETERVEQVLIHARPVDNTPKINHLFTDDYLILRELGRGAFAKVFLAKQISLNRFVALKLSNQEKQKEGALLANLEHDNIVKVYAEVSSPDSTWQGLVLQYVPGLDLGQILKELQSIDLKGQSGQPILDILDRRVSDEVPFDPTGLIDRQIYQRSFPVVMTQLIVKLAEALTLAHSRGILHCDIKPANILLNRYGRPMLVDFNVAIPSAQEGTNTPVGGTLIYMSPEHLASCGKIDEQPAIDHRSDLYALALVTVEAIAGKPLPLADRDARGLTLIVSLWTARVQPEDWLKPLISDIPVPIWRVLRKCLEFQPKDRYADAAEFAAALRNAANQLEREAFVKPTVGLIGRYPMLALLLATYIPHIVGTIFNISYNRIVIHLTEAERIKFDHTTMMYNSIIYPICGGIAIWAVLPILRYFMWRQNDLLDNQSLDRLRHQVIQLGNRAALLACLGWFPGGIIFPLALAQESGVDWLQFLHYFISFSLSGLISLTYSCLGIQYVAIRILYPKLLHPEQTESQRHEEARCILRSITWISITAAAVPLIAAGAQTVFAPADFTLGYRLLVTGLIIGGMLGLGLTLSITRSLSRFVGRITGLER